jgi:hypothetical protein
MQELIDILTELIPAISEALPLASEEEKTDLIGLTKSLSEIVNRGSGLAKQGKSWSAAEDAELVKGHAEGIATADLAKRFSRSEGAIKSRLIKLIIK